MILKDGDVLRHGASHKYDGDAFAEYLHRLSLDGTWETAGDVEFGRHVTLMGRRLLVEDGYGFVSVERYDNEIDARTEFERTESEWAGEQFDSYFGR